MTLRRPVRPDAASAPTHFNATWLKRQLRGVLGSLRNRRLCVAYSGGMDSTALLAALAALRAGEGFELRALHVNHQLQPQALRWSRTARAEAARLGIVCQVIRVGVEHRAGESLEAAARAARYRGFADHLRPQELLLTAHHMEDQLETVLLALARGSGVKGLAAMSAVSAWAATWLVRPLLGVQRAQLQRFAVREHLTWVEDPSNQQLRFDRNYLRHAIVPPLLARWPAIASTVSRSAAHLAEARLLLEQLAHEALRDARDGVALRVSVLRRLSDPQRRNALRQWLAERGLRAPDQRRMREISGPLLAARNDAQAVVRWSDGELRRHADWLFAFAPPRKSPRTHLPASLRWDWRQQRWLALGDGAVLGIVPDRHGDVRLDALPEQLTVSFRAGGERLQTRKGRSALKDLLQRKGVAPWQRASVPLVLDGARVVAVADLWLDEHYAIGQSGNSNRGRFRWRAFSEHGD